MSDYEDEYDYGNYNDYNEYGDDDYDRKGNEDDDFFGDYGQEDQYSAEEDFLDDGPELKAERDVRERAGGGMNLVSSKELKDATPEERFNVYVEAISRSLNSDGIFTIEQKDINTMLERSSFIQNIRYRNPTAFILGYLASKGGVAIDKRRVANIFENMKIPEITEQGITKPDVIRYARYWMNL